MQTDTAPGGVCSHRQSKGYASDPISEVSLSWQGGRRAFTVSSPGHADSPASSTAKRAGAVLGDDRKYIPGHCRFAAWNWSLCFLFGWGMAEASPRTWEQPPGPMCTDVEGFVGLCFHSLPLHQQASQCRALPGKEEGSAAPRALRAREAIGGAAAGCASVHRLCPPAEVGLLSGQAGLWWRDGVG